MKSRLHVTGLSVMGIELEGGCRVGQGKEIYEQYGKSGFYLHTLFKLKNYFIPILAQSLELGRSFVRTEYQPKTLPQLLLWQGLAVFLADKKRCRYLIGPVSISDYFSAASKNTLVAFIQDHYFDHDLAPLVAPRQKFRYRSSTYTYYPEKFLIKKMPALKSLTDLVKDLEPQPIRLPNWLVKYLKQNARIIGFHTDPTAANALHGLLVMKVEDLASVTQLLRDSISQGELGSLGRDE